jgi:RNA polymerase sigma-70 factor (ECF subfamily)
LGIFKLPQRNCRGSGTRHFSAFHKIDSFEGKSQPKTWLFSILNNKVIDYYRLSARPLKKTLTENSGFELSDGLFNSYGCWKSNDISTVWDQEEELLDNPDFNVIMEECMTYQKWKLAVTSKYLSEKKQKPFVRIRNNYV